MDDKIFEETKNTPSKIRRKSAYETSNEINTAMITHMISANKNIANSRKTSTQKLNNIDKNTQ